MIVVPANAGAPIRVVCAFDAGLTSSVLSIGRGVWVPDRRSLCSLVRDDGFRLTAVYAGPLGMSENRVSHATGPMLAATISRAASAPSSKLPRLANW